MTTDPVARETLLEVLDFLWQKESAKMTPDKSALQALGEIKKKFLDQDDERRYKKNK